MRPKSHVPLHHSSRKSDSRSHSSSHCRRVSALIGRRRVSFASCLILLALLVVVAAPVVEALSSSTASVITGASGYVGRAVAHALIQRNILPERNDNDTTTILCLVRPSRVQEEQEYWKKQEEANNKCTTSTTVLVRPYDMLDGGTSLQEVLFGEPCVASADGVCVHHIASWFSPTDNHVQAAQGNVKGTEDLVRVLAEFKNQQKSNNRIKLIVTSSMAAVRATGQEPQNQQFYTHEDWNTLSKLGDNNWGASYQWSKAESERRAKQLCQEFQIPMVALCPSFVFGPLADTATSSSSFSTQLVAQWIQGSSQVQSRLFVDVRDIAQAHVQAEQEDIEGRYIVSTERRLSSSVVARILEDESRALQYTPPSPISYDAAFDGGAIPIGDKEVEAEQRLVDELGIQELQPAEDTIRDMSRVLIGMFLQKEEEESSTR
ncbi:Male sterility protein [Seminavis robusta]|uniref:Male sterility protein n=1 Tax=Seminavis robusta TaxID=568900 RepID=A0A9N8EKU5_9STRA|nr:Male sterility protein [Seminavis robusta]|eukprot:Sro1166_g248200.1 Male sterility protein (434) ;mRNA; f:9141-10442